MGYNQSDPELHASGLVGLLGKSLADRQELLGGTHQAALRIFNGFREGCPTLVIDLYGSTAVFNDYSEAAEGVGELVREAADYLRSRLPWLRAGIAKTRKSTSPNERNGKLLFGEDPDHRIRENGIWYAIDLTLSRDASFYIDTRNLRKWAAESLTAKTVLNAFAYTGSLGVAAAASGASQVVQLDRNRRFLALAKASYRMNDLAIVETDFVQGDFFREAGRFRRANRRFDCVFIDPPFFAAGPSGTVDQLRESARLINKARPLVEDGGYLVAINNALYLSGADYMKTLEQLCADGYLRVEHIVPVPEDCVGYGVQGGKLPLPDPAPFNHSTKIAVMRVRRKDTKGA